MLPSVVSLLDALVPVVVISFVSYIIWYVSQRRPKGFPPGPTPLPIIGNFHKLTPLPFINLLEMKKKYGPIIAIDFASFRGVVINDCQLIREALSMKEFSGRPRLKPFLIRNHGKFRGVLLNDGPSWVEHRRFIFKNLRDFGLGRKSMETIIQDEVDELISILSKLDGKPFEIAYTFNVSALNSLWWIMTGERFQHDNERVQETIRVITDGISNSPVAAASFFLPWAVTIAPRLSGYQLMVDVQMNLLKLARDIYEEQKATFKSGHPRHFFDLYIQEVQDTKDPNSSFYGEEGELHLVTTISDLLIAGLETVSTTMVWSVLLLSLHPDVQDRMFEEMKSVTGLRRFAALSDEPSMPYTKAVIAEVLRFSSILPMNVFHSCLEDVEFHGYRIPKGTMFIPNLYAAHHDPDVWGDPSNFRPERFITEDGQFSKAREQATVPFSSGRRVCIGETLGRNNLFLMHANIFQKFKVFPNPDKPTPTTETKAGFVLHPNSYEYMFKPRPIPQTQ